MRLLRRSGCVLVVALLAMTACAPAPGPAAATGPAAREATTPIRTSGAPPAKGGADCTKASKTAIRETASGTGHQYSFSPGTLTVRRGGFLAITNRSDEVHALVTEPDAGIVTSVVDRHERQVIQFPKAGVFKVESASAAHRAVLHVIVSGESGCAAPEPTLTMTAGNAFTPAHLSLVATENFTVVNESGTSQTVTCEPDPGGNGDHSRLDDAETQLLAIDKPGRYTCTSVQHPEMKAAVTVKAG